MDSELRTKIGKHITKCIEDAKDLAESPYEKYEIKLMEDFAVYCFYEWFRKGGKE